MKNHYIPQLIIKRFSNAINIFDIQTGNIDEKKRPDRVFFKNDIYDEELEKLFCFNIESRIANIIDNKINGKSVIEISREELFLLKKYMLISSVRTLDENHFATLMRKSFKHNAERYIDIYKEYKNLPSTDSLKISDKDLYLRALKVFAQAAYIRDIASNPFATREMLAWAAPFLESYVAFWDTPKDKEFILSDCGMCSEYEGFHLITGGIDISKTSYLFHKVLKERKIQYSGVLASCFVMYENYSIFVLNSTRSLVMINPFFKLFNKPKAISSGNIYEFDIPDIWPAIIQNKELFGMPECKYMISQNFYTQKDLFIYTPKLLSNEDLIYINSLMISYSKEIIGFNDATKIIDSIYYYVWQKSNFNSVREIGEDDKVVMNRLVENVVNSKFRALCDCCNSKGGVNKTEFILLFDILLNYIYKDFNENPYICEYYLDREKDIVNFSKLDFLGKGYKKIEFFKEHLNRINKEKQNAN